MSDAFTLPPASGLARSIRRLFDEAASRAGNGGEAGGRDSVVLRERFTNRVARYLKGDPGLRAELRDAIRGDVAGLLEARHAGPVADAVLALTSGHLPGRAVDPLLPVLLAPEVLAELEARGVTPPGAPLPGR